MYIDNVVGITYHDTLPTLEVIYSIKVYLNVLRIHDTVDISLTVWINLKCNLLLDTCTCLTFLFFTITIRKK